MKNLIKGLKIVVAFLVLLIIAVVLLFGHRDIPLDKLKVKYVNGASSFIAVNGMDVHYRDEGNKADSIPIVLIHGTASSLHTFDAWADSLKKINRVVRMDLPAYGLTGPFPDRNYSIAHYTAFIKDFLKALNIQQCVLAGNSLGGEIAWNFTLEQPGMVTKLILIDAAGYPLHSKSVPIAFKLARIPVVRNLLTYLTPRSVVRDSVENVFFDKQKVTDALVDRYFELTLRAGNRQALVDRLNATADTSAYHQIKSIQQPTLINVVKEDPIRKGLLFAGSERAVYVSFDDGANWQSLRLNMPATSIRDLVIKDDDLVIGTHGRSFWILDDITPLRQLTNQLVTKSTIFYKPQTAMRVRWSSYPDTPLPQEEPAGQNPPDGAIINYYPATDATNVKLQIVDGLGNVIRTYASGDTLYTIPENNVPPYWIRPQQLLSAKAGAHRFTWDMHQQPLNIPATYPIGAVYMNTAPDPTSPWVMQGVYTLRLTVDGKVMNQSMVVNMDPREKKAGKTWLFNTR